jgi:hypothetical protein
MAVTPLYIDKATLISKLRLSATIDTDTLAVVDTAISQVRASFFSRLTSAGALAIVDYTVNENPTTFNEYIRSLAATTEVLWTSYHLICLLPAMHLETQFAIKNNFDDQPLTRDAPALRQYMDELMAMIEKNLGILFAVLNPDTEGSSGFFQSFSCGAEEPFIIGDNHIGLGF